VRQQGIDGKTNRAKNEGPISWLIFTIDTLKVVSSSRSAPLGFYKIFSDGLRPHFFFDSSLAFPPEMGKARAFPASSYP
jgi:hypothetical protein